MKIIEDKNISEDRFTAVTLGNFDGIHLGHQMLISTVKKYSERYKLASVVFSFYPHPMSLFKGDDIFYTILSSNEKKMVVEELDVDILVQYPFTREFAEMKAEDFAELLFNQVKCKVLVVGEDYCFGKNRTGNYDLLCKLGAQRGVEVIKISSVNDDGRRVSSTRIRKCIREHRIKEVNRLLNKPYFVLGNVEEGRKIGRSIGFPTANIVPPENKLLPPDGVYATKTVYDGKIYGSITNIGSNPTVNGKGKTVETYIFDFEKEIYGEQIKVLFFDFLRDEITFDSVDKLKNQIGLDKEKAFRALDVKDCF